MLFLKKLSVYLFGLINLYLFYLILSQPERIWYLLAVIVLILFFVMKFMTAGKLSIKETFIFFSLIFWLVLASVLFLLIVENLYLKYFIIFLATGLSILFLELLFGYLYQPQRYQPFSLVQFFEYSSLLTVFFTATGLFAIHVFLTLSLWWLALFLSVLSFILICQNFWLNKLVIKKYLYYPIIFFIIIFEFVSLLSWWPINYYLKGFLVTVLYFLFINLVNKNIKQSWERKKTWLYVGLCMIVVIGSLVTARWL